LGWGGGGGNDPKGEKLKEGWEYILRRGHHVGLGFEYCTRSFGRPIKKFRSTRKASSQKGWGGESN